MERAAPGERDLAGDGRAYHRPMAIDLNADVGESFGPWSIGEDDALVPLVTSVNVACGFHAGDPATIERTVERAVRAGVAIGAHPGYPDLAGFGRRDLEMRDADIEAAVVYQIGAVDAFARAAGAALAHVKPHGALYNRSARDPRVAAAVARAVRRCAPHLALVGLAGSVSLDAAAAEGLGTIAEAFADRRYEPDGRLRDRRFDDAVLADPAAAAEQAVGIARDGQAVAADGSIVPVRAATLCVHGDLPGAAARAAAVRAALERAGITVEAPGR